MNALAAVDSHRASVSHSVLIVSSAKLRCCLRPAEEITMSEINTSWRISERKCT